MERRFSEVLNDLDLHHPPCALVPVVNPEHITPHTEAFQMVVHHLIITHPRLKAAPTTWESAVKGAGP
jgi:D-sedoheptulose 7-phosphate isomerase